MGHGWRLACSLFCMADDREVEAGSDGAAELASDQATLSDQADQLDRPGQGPTGKTTNDSSAETREPAKKGKSGSKGKKLKDKKLPNDLYEAELFRLQVELVKIQEWAKATGARIVVIFEGRDAAGKGGAIKRLTEYLSPRVARIAALPAPTHRERTQWYFQRYVAHLPAAGEIVLFDRSWYNRAGVERVMEFCTPAEYHRFMKQAPIFEDMLINDGILMRKYWFSVSEKEQYKRFKSRLRDPVRRWKLSPMDLESITKWDEYSRAKDTMFVHTDTPTSPWFVVESDIKKNARINMLAHFISSIPYQDVPQEEVVLPPRVKTRGEYRRTPFELVTHVPDVAAELMAHPDRIGGPVSDLEADM